MSKKRNKYHHETRIYECWLSMKTRCYNKNFRLYHRYGGRGIAVCDEWVHDADSFYEWSIENGYNDNLTLERIDNDKGYSPSNCKWITIQEQAKNRSNNRKETYKGYTGTVKDICDINNIDYKFVINRMLKGMTIKEAIETKKHEKRK